MSDDPKSIWIFESDGRSVPRAGDWVDEQSEAPEGAPEYRRADLLPTISAAMQLPEVQDVLTLLTEARANLKTYVNADYPASTYAEYPDIARRHARDMELCRRIDATLAAIKETKT